MLFKTKNLQQAAALMSQKQFEVFYMELQATPQSYKFEFIFEVAAVEEDFNKWLLDYMNRQTCIEPRGYDASMNSLRDALSVQKNKVR